MQVPMGEAQIGVLGLGVMGSSLARNLASRGFKVAVYNRTKEKLVQFLANYANEGDFVGTSDLAEFVGFLQLPRRIIVMVPDQAVDEVLLELSGVLSVGDFVMDGGNSYFEDTDRRQKMMKEHGVELLGCGVSGGEEGALKGPSLMPSGSEASLAAFLPFLREIAAKDFGGGACVAPMGRSGAGHYVKMVHNGIEYADMQLLAESVLLLRNLCGYELPKIAEIFAKYNDGVLQSFLVEILVPILQKQDDRAEGYLLDKVLDQAGQKGTGRWTAIEALKLGAPASTLMEAVNARSLSANRQLRDEVQKLDLSTMVQKCDLDLVENLEKALYLAKIVAYAQGYDVLKAADLEYGFGLNLAETSRIWQGGCIIRAQLLSLFTELWAKEPNAAHLFMFAEIQEIIKEQIGSLRKIAGLAMQNGLSVPALTSALNYIESLVLPKHPAYVIQALRDSFGAHTYKRVDMPGDFHSDWSGA
ncbi:NADP-dependent phosphogluconate dehydrogenase [Candidatus Gracilibacteria bacterium]|nr:NADP-dependent phosphogluconate dehydrogenase [Candidatus Gracilibacteria bacterium]